MRTLKPLAAALAAAGVIAVPNTASASDPIDLNAACSGPPVVAGDYFCSPGFVALAGPCTIKVPAGGDFTLGNCTVDGVGYPMTIKGGGTSKLTLYNGSISNAAKFELNFGSGHGNGCGDAISAAWRISVADKVDIKANGGINVDAAVNTPVGILADESISVKARFGDVCVKIGYDGTDGLQADRIEIKSDFGSTRVGGPPIPP
jgi:hypothetical protein